MASALGQLLQDKLNVRYAYYQGGEHGLKQAYLNGSTIEYRAKDIEGWIKVVDYDGYDTMRVSNKDYHFRVTIKQETRYAYMYMDGEYIGLYNTDEANPFTNIVVTTENGIITNVLYVGS